MVGLEAHRPDVDDRPLGDQVAAGEPEAAEQTGEQAGVAAGEVDGDDLDAEIAGHDGALAAECLHPSGGCDADVQHGALEVGAQLERFRDERHPPRVLGGARPLDRRADRARVSEHLADDREVVAEGVGVGDDLLPVLAHRAEGVGRQRRQGHGGEAVPGWRRDAEQPADRGGDVAEGVEDPVEDLVDRGAGGVHQRVGRGQVERGVLVRADADAVGRQHERRQALGVERHADADGLDPHRRGRCRRGHIERERLGGPVRPAELRPHPEPRQRPAGTGAEVGLQHVEGRPDPGARGADLDVDRRDDPQAARRPRLGADPEEARGQPEVHGDRVALDGGPRGQEVDDGGEPRGPGGRVRQDVLEPGGDRRDPVGQHLVDR